MDFPEDLKYTKNDEWVRVEGKAATVGITDYAQSQLSDVVYFELTADVGKKLAKGEAFAIVESVKAAAEVYAPVGGTITAANQALADTPELINKEPYGAAWMARLEIADPAELDGLMDAAAYRTHCEAREG